MRRSCQNAVREAAAASGYKRLFDLNDEPARKAFGIQACHYVQENYSWKNIAQQYAQIFGAL